MSLPIEYTPSTITLFIIDSLMGKCHNMLITCTMIEVKQLEEELERQQEAQHPFYTEEWQQRYIERVESARREYDQMSAMERYYTYGESGDAALDDDQDWCSDMEDCLLPRANEEELLPTQELTEVSESEEESKIDFTEEINLNDLYD